MANVTDSVFRGLFAKYGKPDVMWTEFVSADGLCSPGKEKLLADLAYSEAERPIVAQLFTGHPEAMRQAAALAVKLGFDGIDINMGCPDRAVERQGGGAALIKDPQGAMAVLEAAREAAREGVRDGAKTRVLKASRIGEIPVNMIPVSIKTRIGYNKIDLSWIELLLKQDLPALTVHLRTRKEMSDTPAHWELMPEIIKMRDRIQADIDPAKRTLIIGNGDIESLEDGAAKCAEFGCDGVMIGRGIFGRPWLFESISKYSGRDGSSGDGSSGDGSSGDGSSGDSSSKALAKSVKKVDTFQKSPEKTPADRLKTLLEHAKLFEKTFCPPNRKTGGKKNTERLKSFAVMKKHFKAYVSGWDGAKELRAKLMTAENYAETKQIVDEALSAMKPKIH